MRIAAAAYPIDWLESWEAYEAKIRDWVASAHADLLLFPEYGAMELASLAGTDVAGDLARSIQAVSDLLPRVDALHSALASEHECTIIAASAPVDTPGGPVNRARIFGPSGPLGYQDKQIMTRFEREIWDIRPGREGLFVFEIGGVRTGVLICYDAEFPLLGRALVEAGVELILVPSCTDTDAGARRVEIGAAARALEGQCVAVVAPTVGAAPWSPAVDENFGRAAFYVPPDLGFPSSGLLAGGAPNAPGWVRADVNMEAIRRVRREGHVLGLAHWPEQITRLS